MVIDKRYEFPTDTSAKILTSGLLGDQYVGLSPGAEMENLADGGSIDPGLTQGAIVLEKLIGQFLYSQAAGEGESKPADKAPAADPDFPEP